MARSEIGWLFCLGAGRLLCSGARGLFRSREIDDISVLAAVRVLFTPTVRISTGGRAVWYSKATVTCYFHFLRDWI